MGYSPEDEFISHNAWLDLLRAAVDGPMTDAAFRHFVRCFAPKVVGYAQGTCKEETGQETTRRSLDRTDFRDRSAEQFIDK